MKRLALLLVLLSCTSGRERAFSRLASEVNPVLVTLQPTVARLFDPVTPSEEIAVLCAGADPALVQLRSINFDDSALDTSEWHSEVSRFAMYILEGRQYHCHDGEKWSAANAGESELEIARCKRWCLETWQGLVTEVGHLQVSARRAGVTIVPLSGRNR